MKNFIPLYYRVSARWHRQPTLTRGLLIAAILEFFYVLLQYGDSAIFTALRYLPINSAILRGLKLFGYLPVWLAAAAGIALIDYFRVQRRAYLKNLPRDWRKIYARAMLLSGSALVSGLAAEILKLCIRRERPQAMLDVLPVYRDWLAQWWESNNLGMPSSHSATAFGAALALIRLFPSLTPLWWLGASGCALSRVIDQAHTPTDIYAGAVVAWLVGGRYLKISETTFAAHLAPPPRKPFCAAGGNGFD